MKHCKIWGLCPVEPKELRTLTTELDLKFELVSIRRHETTEAVEKVAWFHQSQGVLSFFLLEKGRQITIYRYSKDPSTLAKDALQCVQDTFQ